MGLALITKHHNFLFKNTHFWFGKYSKLMCQFLGKYREAIWCWMIFHIYNTQTLSLNVPVVTTLVATVILHLYEISLNIYFDPMMCIINHLYSSSKYKCYIKSWLSRRYIIMEALFQIVLIHYFFLEWSRLFTPSWGISVMFFSVSL